MGDDIGPWYRDRSGRPRRDHGNGQIAALVHTDRYGRWMYTTYSRAAHLGPSTLSAETEESAMAAADAELLPTDVTPPPADPKLLAMANRALHEQLQAAEAERDRLARILAVERGDESQAPEGWHLRLEDDGPRWYHTCRTARVRRSRGMGWFSRRNAAETEQFHYFALEALEASDG